MKAGYSEEFEEFIFFLVLAIALSSLAKPIKIIIETRVTTTASEYSLMPQAIPILATSQIVAAVVSP